MHENVAETSPRWSDHPVHLSTAARLYLNSLPESPKYWGQVNPNLQNYHSDSMEISITFWVPDISNWCRQPEETHSKYANLSNVAGNILCIVQLSIKVEASISLGQDVIRLMHSTTTSKTLDKTAVARQFAWANYGILAGNDPMFNTTQTENSLELQKEVEERISHKMARTHDFLEMWQGSPNLHTAEKESHAQIKRVTAVGYISHTEEIIKVSWSNIQHDCPAAFQLFKRSPLPPALSSKNHPVGWTRELNVRRMLKVMKEVHLKAFPILKIGLTGVLS